MTQQQRPVAKPVASISEVVTVITAVATVAKFVWPRIKPLLAKLPTGSAGR